MGMRIDVVEGGKIAVLALRANRLRTLLTTVGIGIGVCTLLAIVGIIQGLNTSFADQLSSLGGNSMYVTKFPWIIRGDFYKYRNRRELTPPLAEQLRDIPEVSAVAPMTFKSDEVKFANLQLANVRIQGTTADFPAVAGFLFEDAQPAPDALDGAGPMIARAREALANVDPFTTEAIEAALRGEAERLGLKPRQAFQPIRVAVTGSDVSPPLFESIELLGRDATLSRLAAADAAGSP